MSGTSRRRRRALSFASSLVLASSIVACAFVSTESAEDEDPRDAPAARLIARQPVLPLLLPRPGRTPEAQPVLRLSGVFDGEGDAPLAIRSLELSVDGVGGRFRLRRGDAFADAVLVPGWAGEVASSVRVEGEEPLELRPGDSTLWVFLQPEGLTLDARVRVRCGAVELADGRRLVPRSEAPDGPQRAGVVVRDAGDDGAAVHRIPGLVRTNAGTLLAVYDVRWNGWGDLPGHIDVGLRRSTDDGATWEPQTIVLDQGADETFRHDGVGDPSILVDRRTGTIWIAAVWSHGDNGWHGSGPGLAPEETGQLLLTSSVDDGLTWSAPRNLTREVKDPAWCFLLQGPGRGITMKDGTLVFPAQYQDAQRLPHATVLLSEDHGATWRLGTGAKPDTTEAAVVELVPGTLMLNMRDNRREGAPGGGGARSVYTSTDKGRTWNAHPTSRRALVEPVCMASLLQVPFAGEELLLFSNPAVSTPPRRRLTVRASSDAGATWSRGLLLDEGRSAGYSCLSRAGEEAVGILYESSRAQLLFQRVPLADLRP